MKKIYTKLLLALSATILSLSLSACGLFPNPLDDDKKTEVKVPTDYSDVSVWVESARIGHYGSAASTSKNSNQVQYTIKANPGSHKITTIGAETGPREFSKEGSGTFLTYRAGGTSQTMVVIKPYVILTDGKKISGKIVTVRK